MEDNKGMLNPQSENQEPSCAATMHDQTDVGTNCGKEVSYEE
jgi:hypothetical protein